MSNYITPSLPCETAMKKELTTEDLELLQAGMVIRLDRDHQASPGHHFAN